MTQTQAQRHRVHSKPAASESTSLSAEDKRRRRPPAPAPARNGQRWLNRAGRATNAELPDAEKEITAACDAGFRRRIPARSMASFLALHDETARDGMAQEQWTEAYARR
jgi:hypothetical protein